MAVGDAPAFDPNLYGYSDDPPLLPAGATVAAPSIAEQQRQPAEQSAPASSGDNLPLAPAQPPGILDSSWSVAGKQLWSCCSRGVGLGTRDVVEGGTSPVTGALDLATWPMRALQRAFGVPTTAPSDLVTKSLDAAGLPTPQTPTEQNISTFNRGAAATLPSIALGGFPSVAARVPAVAQPFRGRTDSQRATGGACIGGRRHGGRRRREGGRLRSCANMAQARREHRCRYRGRQVCRCRREPRRQDLQRRRRQHEPDL